MSDLPETAHAQQQRPPGATGDMEPRPRDEMRDYVGAGHLAGKKALITGGDSGIGRAVSVAFAKEGDSLLAGERIGLIRFGSRVDVYMPAGCVPLVAVGSKAVAGETIIAEFALNAARRQFRSR